MRDRRLVPRALAVSVAVLGLVAVPAVATADHGGCAGAGSVFGCNSHSGGSNGGGGGGGGGGGNGDPGIFTVELTDHPDAEDRCWHIVTGGTKTWSEAAALLESVGENVDGDGEAIAWGSCPGRPSTPPVPDIWRSMLCPPPPPTPLAMAPGHAVAGRPGYLEIRGPQTVDVACLGETIRATARYVVKWGDGEETPTSSRGGPWPSGDVTHTYTDADGVTITVEAYWTGVWRGTELPELPVPTTEQLPLEVREVQAVRDR